MIVSIVLSDTPKGFNTDDGIRRATTQHVHIEVRITGITFQYR